MIAVILAGGPGKRLKRLTTDKPKPMIPISGKPVLEHQLAVLRRYDIDSVCILTGHKASNIEEYFCDGKRFGIEITYLREDVPLGTAGAVKQLEERTDSDFLLIYGDILFDVKLNDFISFHKEKGSAATLIVHPTDHPYDSDLVATDDKSRITHILNKPHSVEYYRNLGNAGIYCLSPTVFRYIPAGGQSDFMKDIFPKMLDQSENLYAYKTAEYIKDMGTPERLEKVRRDFRTGKVKRLSKEFSRPAIFIDRDGTLVKDVDLLHKVEDLELYEFSSSAVSKINQSDFLGILVTNQSVVARNLCDISTVHQIHNKLETLLGRNGTYLDDIFFCPHHPDKGYPEENPDYKMDCKCRKPNVGMLEKAVSMYNLDAKSSWVIGDSTIDIQTGINSGMNTILVRTGKGGKDGTYPAEPDFVFDNLKEAIEFVLEGIRALQEAAMRIINHMDWGNLPNIITVGGPARSGKSTFVKCMQDCLHRQNVPVIIISLDNWLLGANERTESMGVRQRYKYPEIEEDIKELLKGNEIQPRIYDPYSRAVFQGTPFSLDKKGCLIIEGVPTLDIEALRGISDVRVYCEIGEHERKNRFVSFYRWKGFPENKIQALYNKRINDELPIIESSKNYADFIISSEGIKVYRQP